MLVVMVTNENLKMDLKIETKSNVSQWELSYRNKNNPATDDMSSSKL